MSAHEPIYFSRGQKLAEPATASGFVVGSGLVGVVGFIWVVATNPAMTRAQLVSRLTVSIVGSMLFGSMLLELLNQFFGIHFDNLQSQLAVCLIPASFLWVVMSIISHQLERWNNSKNPLREITKDIREARRGVK